MGQSTSSTRPAATETYLAKPSGQCCLDGTIHQGKPRGSWETIAGVETYIARPLPGKANGNILLYFPDVWGMFPNGLLVMDAFADAGYLTLGLDYFRGDPVWKHRKNRHDNKTDPNFDYEAWKRKHAAFAHEAVPKWMSACKAKYGTAPATKYACVGYCFGAPYVCNALADKNNNNSDVVVTAGAFAHPAFLREHHFENLANHTFDVESRRQALDILQRRNKVHHYQLFSGVEHGFALRGNPDDPYQRWVKEQSISSIVGWFDFWLSR